MDCPLDRSVSFPLHKNTPESSTICIQFKLWNAYLNTVMSHITASVLIVVGGWCKKLFQRINLHPSAVILVAIAT